MKVFKAAVAGLIAVAVLAPTTPALGAPSPSPSTASTSSPKVGALKIDPSRQMVEWKFGATKGVRFEVSAQKTPKAKAQVLRVPSTSIARKGSSYSWVIPFQSLGPVKVRPVIRKKVGKKTRWVPGAWSAPATVQWGTSARVQSAAAAGGKTLVSTFGDSKSVRVVFSNTPSLGSGDVAVEAATSLGLATITAEGEFGYVTITGLTDGRTGQPGTSVVELSAITDLTVQRLSAAQVSLGWKNVGDVLISGVRRTSGETAATSINDGALVNIGSDGASLVDTDIAPGNDYTYTVFASSRGQALTPVSIQVHTPAASTDEAAGDSWVLAPNTSVLTPGDYELVATTDNESDRALFLNDAIVKSRVEGSTALIVIDRPTARGQELVGTGMILEHSARLPGGFVGEVVKQENSRLWLRQAPIDFVAATLRANMTPVANTRQRLTPQTPSVRSGSCTGGIDIATLPFSMEVANLQPSGHANFDWADSELSLRVTVDATFKAQIAKGSVFGECTWGLVVPPQPFTLGIVPMLAKFDANLGVKIEFEGSGQSWSSTHRLGFHVEVNRSGPTNQWINEKIARTSTAVGEAKLMVTLSAEGAVIVGPGLGAEGMGIVAGLTGSNNPRATIGTDPGSIFNRTEDTCLSLEPAVHLSYGLKATAWVNFGPVSNNWDLFEATLKTTIYLIVEDPHKVAIACWGAGDDEGGEGPGDTSPSTLQITAGEAHTCVLRSGGGVECWGSNYYGQLGNGATRSNSATPVPVQGLSGALQGAAGGDHTCAILSDGTVQCWGKNGSGQLGDGTRLNRSVPVTVKGISGAQRLAAGDNHTCAILSDGNIKCWGYNGSGQLGDGTTEDRLAPVSVKGISSAQRIAAGRFDTCAVIAGGTVQCWGMSLQPSLPGPAPGRGGIPDAREIAMGGSHKCALVSDGIVKCWGSNSEGQFGNGTTGDSPAPAAARGVAGARKIAAGGAHTCAILARGAVKCWGSNFSGQLGDGSTQEHLTPVVVKGISGAQQIAAGTGHTCAIVANGFVKCWGSNSQGQLGTQSAAPSGFLSVIKWIQ